MAKIRDRERTRRRIVEAAAREFSEKGYDGATLSGVARRANASKQLIHHHFGSKAGLFRQVHDEKFRRSANAREMVPDDPRELFAARFEKHADDLQYIRFLTWEAAGGRRRAVPYETARRRRIEEYGDAIAELQAGRRLPESLNPRLLQLAVLALATYPMSFAQITRFVTGRSPTDAEFRQEWMDFLRALGQAVLQPSVGKVKAPRRRSAERLSKDS
jgi:AcrR family transcriptional regulator